MPNRDDILWFKNAFQARIEPALVGTPLTVDLMVALACQETGEIWPILRHKKALTLDRILALCVGDTLDADRGRRAFPKTKTALLAKPNGPEMFAIAHQALVDMAVHIASYQAVAKKENKFCHGFGIFQRDLQFFLDDPDYFLRKRYERFEESLGQCIDELNRGLQELGWSNRTALSSLEMAELAIAYNTGGFNPRLGLNQGHNDGSKSYGQAVYDFIMLSQTVASPGATAPVLASPPPGQAIVPPASPVTATGPFLRVDTRVSTLRLRSEPSISSPPTKNVIGELPDGHIVRAVSGTVVKKFLEVETSLRGALLRGYAAAEFLVPDAVATNIPVVQSSPQLPATGVTAVFMPRKAGTVTRRKDGASAHSLNEPNQPPRQGQAAEELRAELGKIIDWLAVDAPANKRYQPHDGLTFCNIYCHDYCHLAGVYIPRVWWSPKAVVALSAGKSVAPLIGNTIDEMRANDLFRWLRDFGLAFGWRQTANLTNLQQGANQGAVCLIVARRKQDGRSGHIVAVVPETGDQRATRNADGEVTSPLQSQAGSTNFRYGRGRADWWKGEQFAESAFWIHA